MRAAGAPVEVVFRWKFETAVSADYLLGGEGLAGPLLSGKSLSLILVSLHQIKFKFKLQLPGVLGFWGSRASGLGRQ